MSDSTVNISNITDTIIKLLKIKDNGDGTFSVSVALAGGGGFNIPTYDYISLSYTGSNLTGVVFKSGGSGGTTVATLTLAYTGSNLTSVTKT